MFDEVGMMALREKSERMISYLQFLLDRIAPRGGGPRFEVITPRPLAERGCQFSMFVHDRPRELFKRLEDSGVVCDFREPNVVRVAPTPLYNTFHEIWRFARVLEEHSKQ
jgi:kynureninase